MNLILKHILQLFYHKGFRVVKVDLLKDTNKIQEIQWRTLVNEILLEYFVNPMKSQDVIN